MQRLTLKQISNTLIPQSIGCCSDDLQTLAAYLNEAVQNLCFSGGETGFSGGWQRISFNVDPDDPYLICPREVARLVNADVRKNPTRISNEWYEFLESGPGLQNVCGCGPESCLCGTVAIYDRGFFPPLDLPSGQLLRAYPTNTADIGKRILFSRATDQNGNRIYGLDGNLNVDGFYLTLDSPFSTTAFEVLSFQSILKDACFGDVVLKRVDSTTGDEVTIARFQPDEVTPNYRKYFFKRLPRPISPATTIQVTAMAKLEFIPLVRDTDFLLISNIPALRAECESIRYSRMDNPAAQAMAFQKHRQAIRYLQNEQRHYQGEQTPAITVVSAMDHAGRRGIGTMT